MTRQIGCLVPFYSLINTPEKRRSWDPTTPPPLRNETHLGVQLEGIKIFHNPRQGRIFPFNDVHSSISSLSSFALPACLVGGQYSSWGRQEEESHGRTSDKGTLMEVGNIFPRCWTAIIIISFICNGIIIYRRALMLFIHRIIRIIILLSAISSVRCERQGAMKSIALGSIIPLFWLPAFHFVPVISTEP